MATLYDKLAQKLRGDGHAGLYVAPPKAVLFIQSLGFHGLLQPQCNSASAGGD